MNPFPSTHNYIANLSRESPRTFENDFLAQGSTEPAMINKACAVALGLSFGFIPPVSAHHEGQCYISHNKHHICVVRIGKHEFAAAITNGFSIEPSVVAFHCLKGWSGAGDLPEESMAMVVSAICSYSDKEQSPRTSVAGQFSFRKI